MAIGLIQAHALVMILSFTTFGSIGILVARYGRSLRMGHRRQLLGKAVWFQIHRFFLTFTSIFTLIGFLLIFVRKEGKWTNPTVSSIFSFVHSIFGGTIVCCVTIQIWLALYRCHPSSPFRYIFDWTHRITGFLAFILSIPTIFLMIFRYPKYRIELCTLFSFWTACLITIVIFLEKNEWKQRRTTSPITNSDTQTEANNENKKRSQRVDIEAATIQNVGSQKYNKIKALILFLHIIITICISTTLIVLMCI